MYIYICIRSTSIYIYIIFAQHGACVHMSCTCFPFRAFLQSFSVGPTIWNQTPFMSCVLCFNDSRTCLKRSRRSWRLQRCACVNLSQTIHRTNYILFRLMQIGRCGSGLLRKNFAWLKQDWRHWRAGCLGKAVQELKLNNSRPLVDHVSLYLLVPPCTSLYLVLPPCA